MTLRDFLKLIQDEELRIEIEVDTGEEEYSYFSFWLSDYVELGNRITSYIDYDVESIRFNDFNDPHSELLIHIEKP